MKRGAIGNRADPQLGELGVRKRIEIKGGKICINDFDMPGVDQPVDVPYGVKRAAVAPIGERFRLEIRFKNWIQRQVISVIKGRKCSLIFMLRAMTLPTLWPSFTHFEFEPVIAAKPPAMGSKTSPRSSNRGSRKLGKSWSDCFTSSRAFASWPAFFAIRASR